MKPERIAELRALIDAATPDPWKKDRNWHITGPDHSWDTTFPRGEGSQIVSQICGPGTHAIADQNFVIAARQVVPELLDALEMAIRQRDELDALARSDTGELWADECERARKERDAWAERASARARSNLDLQERAETAERKRDEWRERSADNERVCCHCHGATKDGSWDDAPSHRERAEVAQQALEEILQHVDGSSGPGWQAVGIARKTLAKLSTPRIGGTT